MDYNNGFSISSFFLSSLSFLWIGAQFPQEKFLSYGPQDAEDARDMSCVPCQLIPVLIRAKDPRDGWIPDTIIAVLHLQAFLLFIFDHFFSYQNVSSLFSLISS